MHQQPTMEHHSCNQNNSPAAPASAESPSSFVIDPVDCTNVVDANEADWNHCACSRQDNLRLGCMHTNLDMERRRMTRDEMTGRRNNHETDCVTDFCSSGVGTNDCHPILSIRSLRRRRNKRHGMNVSLLVLAILSCCHCCNGNPIRMQRQTSISASKMRKLRPEYKSLLGDDSSVVEGDASMSMSISFDVSASVKSLSLEFSTNLHNKTSIDQTASPTFLPLQPLSFNPTNERLSPSPSFQPSSNLIPAVAELITEALDEPTQPPTLTPTGAPWDSLTNVSSTESPTVSLSEAPATESLKSLASEYLANLHNKSSIEQTSSPTFLPLQPFAFNTMNETLSPSPSLEPSSHSIPAVDSTNIPLNLPTPAPELISASTDEPTQPPTPAPTGAPSDSPTNAPYTESPTESPSEAPVTESPSKAPTEEPTKSPSLSPVTAAPTTAAPSRSPVEGPQPTGSPSVSSFPTENPTVSPTFSLPTPSPMIGEQTSPSRSSTELPTPKASVPLQTFLVPTTMIFYTSGRFKGQVLETWKRVTGSRIKKYTLIEMDDAGETASESDLSVELEMVGQVNLQRRRTLKTTDRTLQEGTLPLVVNYTTIIQFYSLIEDWNSTAFVASGFITESQQKNYMYQLKAADTTNFDSIEKFDMLVNETEVTEEPEEPKTEPDDGNSTLIWAIIGAAGGILATAFLVGTVLCVRKRRRKNGRSSSSVEEDDKFPDTGLPNKAGSTAPQSSSYFGTIESREGEQDDVSTLGDPYFGEAVNAVMDRDDTVAESMISAEQDMYVYGVGRPRLDTGASSRMDSTFSGKSNPNKVIFNDDTTLEEIYKSPDTVVFDQEGGNAERITVVAPSGKLGIVIDNPTGDIPLVHAIKESSALNGRIRVGDRLLSVDERDCRGMSAVAVSKLISSRSENPSRTFVIMR